MILKVRSQLGLAERLGVKAMDDCGPASLATAATDLGVDTSTKAAHKACAQAGRVDTPTGAEGTSAAQVRDAAKILGLKARIVYDWSEASNETKAGSILILNIQASQKVVPDRLRSKWQRDYWRKQPLATYGHWVVLAYSNSTWRIATPLGSMLALQCRKAKRGAGRFLRKLKPCAIARAMLGFQHRPQWC